MPEKSASVEKLPLYWMIFIYTYIIRREVQEFYSTENNGEKFLRIHFYKYFITFNCEPCFKIYKCEANSLLLSKKIIFPR